mgnify:CR=1|jgi:hypothetical protein
MTDFFLLLQQNRYFYTEFGLQLRLVINHHPLQLKMVTQRVVFEQCLHLIAEVTSLMHQQTELVDQGSLSARKIGPLSRTT